ncbi:WD domain, G-beta repeat [Popillia japonica]|uniref:Coronin n=1 Tax=Popillia japonica TaxID=7064 RepID=A0AAW1IAE8_POPJA
MAWRFKASKYKNAAPIVPKPETYVRDVCVGSYQTYGNNITASAKFMAFNWDHAGSSLAVLPIDDSGRKNKLMPLLYAHTDTVTDMDFSPFHDGLLATGSQDCLVKVWNIPEDGLQESLSNPECTFSHKQKRVETVGFHPTAEFLLYSTSYTVLTLWDLLSEQEIYMNQDHTDVIQSVSWKRDGTLLATSNKDKQVRIIDPRASDCCIKTASSHQSIKDSRVVWLGENDKILTTGFDAQRFRQIIVRDLRKFAEPEKSLELDCSTGILIPLYDADTGMLFLAGKGDSTIGYMEVSDKEPYLTEGIRHSGEQTKGACLVPKRALNVMQGEVNRVLQLTSSSVIPITYQVPRKTYRDFHADLYPDTPGYSTELTASMWMSGRDIPLQKISLDPSKRPNGENPLVIHRGSLAKLKEEYNNKPLPSQLEPQPIEQQVIKDTQYVKRSKNIAITPKERDNSQQQEQTQQSQVPQNQQEEDSSLERGGDLKVNSTVDEACKGSMCDQPTDTDAVIQPIPVARPRTNSCAPVITSVNPYVPIAGGYKPRLGPKPFTPLKLNESDSFDKMFSVPVAPTCHTNGIHDSLLEEEKEEKSSVENETTGQENIAEVKKEEEQVKLDVDQTPKTPSTAERRKLFETPTKESDVADSIVDAGDSGFERNTVQRTSIAERRKMYENRSQSVQEGMMEKPDGSPSPLRRKDSFKSNKTDEMSKSKSTSVVNKAGGDAQGLKKEAAVTPAPKRTSTVFGRVSKFRHLKGTPAHKSQHIENIRNLSRQISGECDGFSANPKRVAVPLSGPGGKIAIFEVAKTGRLADGVIPALVHGSNIMDFSWDPFDDSHLAVACDDGVVKLWKIPETGLTEPTNAPDREFNAHNDKIYFLKFHSTAKDVLATGSYDMTIKIWDLTSLEMKIQLEGHTDQMFSFAWSPCGSRCATVSKDGRIRVYEPRKVHNEPVLEGARIVWALDGAFLVVTGFDKVSERQISVFKVDDLEEALNTVGLDVSPAILIPFYDEDSSTLFDLEEALNTVGLDVSPAILIPFYDEDSSTLFVTGKGDSTIYAFEITEEPPYICALSHHRCNTLHQGLSFLPKNVCDVVNVEFSKALRLTNNSIEPLSFTVPRIKTELFQDDLFPPTKVTWEPTMTSAEWFAGTTVFPRRISLRPEGMDLLSDSQSNAGERTINKSASQPYISSQAAAFGRLGWTADMAHHTKAKQEEIQKTISSRVEMNLKLEQDDMEGVDEKEWEE